MALNGLNCAAVPLRIYSLTHSLAEAYMHAERIFGVVSYDFHT